MAYDSGMVTLQAMLQSQPRLRVRGFTFAIESPTVLIVSRGPHVRGIWRVEELAYAWFPSGYSEPAHIADSPEAALSYTLEALAGSD